MIVLAIVAIVLTTAIPVYQNYAIRARATEGLSLAAAAKLAVAESCQSQPARVVRSNADTDYSFTESMAPDSYVADIRILADCASGAMWVGVRTKNTGARVDPVFLLTTNGLLRPVRLGESGDYAGAVGWDCWGLAASAAHLPSGCRPSRERFEDQIF